MICELEFRGCQAPPLLSPSPLWLVGAEGFLFISLYFSHSAPDLSGRRLLSSLDPEGAPCRWQRAEELKALTPPSPFLEEPPSFGRALRGAARAAQAAQLSWPLECTAAEGGEPSPGNFTSELVAVSRGRQQDADRAV